MVYLPSTFYADEPDHMLATINEQRSPLSEKSLAYLYRFTYLRPKLRQTIAGISPIRLRPLPDLNQPASTKPGRFTLLS